MSYFSRKDLAELDPLIDRRFPHDQAGILRNLPFIAMLAGCAVHLYSQDAYEKRIVFSHDCFGAARAEQL